MQPKIDAFKQHVRQLAANPSFMHHKWFVQWHLEIVERIALELADRHPEADHDAVEVLVWLHDYGKLIDHANEYQATLTEGLKTLKRIGFDDAFVKQVVDYAETLDKKMEIDLHTAPIEVQIVSSADGCSHMVGPFLSIFWHEDTEPTFTNKTFQELMQLNRDKIHKDWQRKIVLPEARQAFEQRYLLLLEHSGELPDRFIP